MGIKPKHINCILYRADLMNKTHTKKNQQWVLSFKIAKCVQFFNGYGTYFKNFIYRTKEQNSLLEWQPSELIVYFICIFTRYYRLVHCVQNMDLFNLKNCRKLYKLLTQRKNFPQRTPWDCEIVRYSEVSFTLYGQR